MLLTLTSESSIASLVRIASSPAMSVCMIEIAVFGVRLRYSMVVFDSMMMQLGVNGEVGA
jgi:hypothetical protein